MNSVEAPDVSIILPVRNAANLLDTAFSAIYAQKGIRLEVIVVDGNSIDETFVVVQKWLRPHDVYIRGNDNGIYDAINKGVSISKGQWLFIQGSDDVLAHENVLANLLAASHPNSRLLYGNVEYKNVASHWVKQLHVSSFGWGLLLRNTLHQQSVLYHHSLFKQNEFRVDFKVLADYAFHLKLFFRHIIRHDAVLKVDTIVCHCGAGGISKKFTANLYREEWQVRREVLPLWLYIISSPFPFFKFLLKARR